MEMEGKRVLDAAATGNVRKLQELRENDPFLLDRVSYNSPNNTPLHTATRKGHLTFVEEILRLNPQLSEELNSQQSSALHIASANGHLQIMRKLMEASPEMCQSRDSQGRTPLHLAAMRGHVQVVAELVQKAPFAAREKLGGGLTVLHLCVKYGQFEVLKILVKELGDFINVKNDHGETILDMAILGKKEEIIQYLRGLSSTKKWLTKRAHTNSNGQSVKWLTKKRDSIMVVAILIATMAFQIGVSPPGGVWQEDSNPLDAKPHRAGESVMAYNHPKAFKSFMRSNTICFVSSLSTILLLISGLPFRRPEFMWILMVIMWLTITSVAVTFAISAVVVTPKKDKKSLTNVIKTSVAVWIGVMGILLVGNTVRLVDRWLKNRGVVVWRPKCFRNSVDVGSEDARQVSVLVN